MTVVWVVEIVHESSEDYQQGSDVRVITATKVRAHRYRRMMKKMYKDRWSSFDDECGNGKCHALVRRAHLEKLQHKLFSDQRVYFDTLYDEGVYNDHDPPQYFMRNFPQYALFLTITPDKQSINGSNSMTKQEYDRHFKTFWWGIPVLKPPLRQ